MGNALFRLYVMYTVQSFNFFELLFHSQNHWIFHDMVYSEIKVQQIYGNSPLGYQMHQDSFQSTLEHLSFRCTYLSLISLIGEVYPREWKICIRQFSQNSKFAPKISHVREKSLGYSCTHAATCSCC